MENSGNESLSLMIVEEIVGEFGCPFPLKNIFKIMSSNILLSFFFIKTF